MTTTAEIIADSISESGVRITTFELEYWRGIHGEFMTHRQFSRNAASSRAIPVKSMLDNIRNDIAKPARFGQNKAGMQDTGDEYFAQIAHNYTADEWWDLASKSAVNFAEAFAEAGYAKQVANRLTEPFQHMKVVVTATSYDNFFWLRNHEDADPSIHVLANTMLAAFNDSKPRVLLPGEWHLPYYQDGYWSEVSDGVDSYGNTLDQARKISASCCAQVSYRRLNDSLEKAEDIFAKLIESTPCHASPVEHQATPMERPTWRPGDSDAGKDFVWEAGVTHMECYGDFWSGNFKHWVQFRQLIPNHTCWKYEELS